MFAGDVLVNCLLVAWRLGKLIDHCFFLRLRLLFAVRFPGGFYGFCNVGCGCFVLVSALYAMSCPFDFFTRRIPIDPFRVPASHSFSSFP